jgi:hypothetical protein
VVGVGSANNCGEGHDKMRALSVIFSLGRRGISNQLLWRIQQMCTLLWPLFSRLAWAQPATGLEGTISEGAVLASVTLVGVGSASHRDDGQDK